MSNSYSSFLLSSPANESMILNRKVGFFRSRCSPCRLYQGSFQPFICLAHFSTLPLLSTLIVPWIDPCPRTQMPMHWKSLHVYTDFRNYGFRQRLPHSRNRLQKLYLLDKRLGVTLHLLIQAFNRLL